MEKIFAEPISETKILELSPLELAFIGDGVHTMFIRDKEVKKTNLTVNNVHKNCVHYCRAESQAQKLEECYNILNEQEQDVVRRARNAKNHNSAKNASEKQYKMATAYEALIGYLWISGKYDRLNEILKYKEKEKC